MFRGSEFDSNERKIILACFICMLLSLWVLGGGDAYFWGRDGVLSSQPAIAVVQSAQNDSRLRNSSSFVWYGARRKEKVRLGDSIFCGTKSSAVVNLAKGGKLSIGENSIVTFEMIDDEQVPNLGVGAFQIHVNGNVRVAINGEMATLQGDGAHVIVEVDRNKHATLRSLDGEVKVTGRDGRKLSFDDRSKLQINQPRPAPVGNDQLRVAGGAYYYRLYDLYDRNEETEFILRPRSPKVVVRPTELRWSSKAGGRALVQHAATDEFHDATESHSDFGFLTLDRVFVGENSWRVSTDEGRTWSLAQHFTVTPQYRPHAEPVLAQTEQDVLMPTPEPTSVEIPIRSTVDAQGFVAEASLEPDFRAEATRTFWTPEGHPRLVFYKPGTYYYRFRSVVKDQEVSDWSRPLKYVVHGPVPPPPAPAPVAPPLPALKTLAARDGHPKKTSTLPPIAKKPAADLRKPAATATATDTAVAENHLKMDVPGGFLNEKFADSQIAAGGFVWTMQSSQQYYQSQTAPVASGLGFRSLTWGDRWGVEALGRVGFLTLNGAHEGTTVRDLEARVHRRWITSAPLRFARELRISAFAGYELYRNSGVSFSNQYDLLKFGTSIDFPMGRHWSSGGDLAYGLGPEGSRKEEIAGRLNYFFDPDWSIGVGYRLNLFEAGSRAAAPAGQLPYREGYTEAFSVLNRHF